MRMPMCDDMSSFTRLHRCPARMCSCQNATGNGRVVGGVESSTLLSQPIYADVIHSCIDGLYAGLF